MYEELNRTRTPNPGASFVPLWYETPLNLYSTCNGILARIEEGLYIPLYLNVCPNISRYAPHMHFLCF